VGSENDISAYLSNSAKIKEISLPKKQSELSGQNISYDYDGYVFRVLTSDAARGRIGNSNILSEDMYSDALRATAYMRNSAVSEMLNVEIREIISEEIGIDMKKSFLSSDDNYDLLSFHANREMALQLQSAALTDLKKVSTLKLDNPWYDSSCVRDLEIANKLYLLTGDVIAGNSDSVSAMVYNRDLAQELGYYSPDGGIFEKYVASGEWTLDTLNMITTDINENITGDNSNLGAFYIGGLDSFSLCIGAGASSFNKGADGTPEINLNSDKFLDIFSKVLSIQLLPVGSSEISAASFTNGNTLFDTVTLGDLKTLSGSGIKIGVLPMPKYDKNQTQYRSVVNFKDAVAIAIPSTNSELDRTGVIIEQLSAESSWYMWDSYYNSIIENNEDTIRMIKTVLASKIFDLGDLFGWANIPKALNELTVPNGISSFKEQMTGRSNAAMFAMNLILKKIK